MASSVIGPAASELRKTWTMSTGWGISAKVAYAVSPRISVPAALGFTGMMRKPFLCRYFMA